MKYVIGALKWKLPRARLPFNPARQHVVAEFKSGGDFRVGSGSGLSLSKCFWPISGLHTQVCYTIQSNDFFSWRAFVLLTAVTFVGEVIVIFLQQILFANTDAFFCSLLGLVSHSFLEGDRCEEISRRCHCV